MTREQFTHFSTRDACVLVPSGEFGSGARVLPRYFAWGLSEAWLRMFPKESVEGPQMQYMRKTNLTYIGQK